MSLSEIEVKKECIINRVTGDRTLKKRLLEMGFIRGTKIHVEKVAPLGDPMELTLKGYHVALRRAEAKNIEVELA